jgi:hypothetical protein
MKTLRGVSVTEPVANEFVMDDFVLHLEGPNAGTVFIVDDTGERRPATEAEMKIGEHLMPFLGRANVKHALRRMREAAPNIDLDDLREVLKELGIDWVEELLELWLFQFVSEHSGDQPPATEAAVKTAERLIPFLGNPEVKAALRESAPGVGDLDRLRESFMQELGMDWIQQLVELWLANLVSNDDPKA